MYISDLMWDYVVLPNSDGLGVGGQVIAEPAVHHVGAAVGGRPRPAKEGDKARSQDHLKSANQQIYIG